MGWFDGVGADQAQEARMIALRLVVFNILFGVFIAAWVLYPWLGVPAALGVIGWGYRHA